MCIWCKVTQRDSVTLSSKYSNNISARINSDPTFDMNLATLGCVSRLRLWVFVSPSTPTVYVTAAARSIVVFNIPLNWVYAVSPTWYFTFRRLHSLTTIDYFRPIQTLICCRINQWSGLFMDAFPQLSPTQVGETLSFFLAFSMTFLH